MAMDTAAMWIGYAVMMIGAFVVCTGVLIGAAMVSNKMSHMVLDAYGGWKVFLEFRDWYHSERPKVGADKTANVESRGATPEGGASPGTQG
jgi:hypothetical protein